MAASNGRICIIGAGVTGLSTAITLLEKEYDVCVCVRDKIDETTSSAAAAFWYPFWTGSKPDHSWYRSEWALSTLQKLREFAGRPGTGVTETTIREYFETSARAFDVVDTMWWRFLPELGFDWLPISDVSARECESADGTLLHFTSGVFFRTLVVNMRDYLPYLWGIVEVDDRAEIRLTEVGPAAADGITGIDELFEEFDAVINCAGLGGERLTGQERQRYMFRREGVVLRHTPIEGVKDIILMHTGDYYDRAPLYIVPRPGKENDIILGGSLTDLEWHEDYRAKHYSWPLPEDATEELRADVRRIFGGCRSFEPNLDERKLIGVSVGHRPVRQLPTNEDHAARLAGKTTGVRVELDARTAGETPLVHNYGHGGGGVTLSWGCALRAIELMKRGLGNM